ncbi:MAG: hydrolase, partial [Bacteroidota bacterium]|nr:hydrolase [Bacteroidota bacterium]
LASRDNAWSGKLFYHRSFSPENPGKQYAQGSSLTYNTRRIHAGMAQASVGENYSAESGYVRRTGYNLLNPEFSFLWVPNKKVVSHGFVAEADYFFDSGYNQIDHEFTLMYKFEFSNRSILDAGFMDFYTRLDKDFDPTHISQTVLKKGAEYSTNALFLEYFSDTRSILNYSATVAKGGFYSGKISILEGKVTYRYQPYLNMTVNFSYNDINLPAPFERARFWLIGPKLDLTLSDKVFFSTFVQYNEQIDNMNINMRFQWRYQPVSDLFIVYTDNYYTGDWNSRNRALVLKLSYWFN